MATPKHETFDYLHLNLTYFEMHPDTDEPPFQLTTSQSTSNLRTYTPETRARYRKYPITDAHRAHIDTLLNRIDTEIQKIMNDADTSG